jgi:chitinase
MLDTYFKTNEWYQYPTFPENGIYLLHGASTDNSFGSSIKEIQGATIPLGRVAQRLSQALNDVVNFLNNNPTEIVTIFLEDYTTKDQLKQEIERVAGIKNLLFDPDQDDPNTSMNEDIKSAKQWPLISEMIESLL